MVPVTKALESPRCLRYRVRLDSEIRGAIFVVFNRGELFTFDVHTLNGTNPHSVSTRVKQVAEVFNQGLGTAFT